MPRFPQCIIIFYCTAPSGLTPYQRWQCHLMCYYTSHIKYHNMSPMRLQLFTYLTLVSHQQLFKLSIYTTTSSIPHSSTIYNCWSTTNSCTLGLLICFFLHLVVCNTSLYGTEQWHSIYDCERVCPPLTSLSCIATYKCGLHTFWQTNKKCCDNQQKSLLIIILLLLLMMMMIW